MPRELVQTTGPRTSAPTLALVSQASAPPDLALPAQNLHAQELARMDEAAANAAVAGDLKRGNSTTGQHGSFLRSPSDALFVSLQPANASAAHVDATVEPEAAAPVPKPPLHKCQTLVALTRKREPKSPPRIAAPTKKAKSKADAMGEELIELPESEKAKYRDWWSRLTRPADPNPEETAAVQVKSEPVAVKAEPPHGSMEPATDAMRLEALLLSCRACCGQVWALRSRLCKVRPRTLGCR